MPVSRIRLSLMLLATLPLASCEHGNPPPVQQQHTSAPPMATPRQHWVQGERLRKVMDQISGLRGAFPKGLPEDAESPSGREARQALAEAAAVSNALADAARQIADVVETRKLSEADRRGFLAEALTLHDQAILLRNAARRNQLEPLQGMLDNINATCISCHSRYRDLSGDMNVHRAMAPARVPMAVARGVGE